MDNRVIIVDYNIKSLIVSECNTSFATVKKALNGDIPCKKHEKLYYKIRESALKHGGVKKPRKIYTSKNSIENIL